MSWVWREGGALSGGQHDLCYMYSDDGGKTFKNHLGTIVTEGNTRANINSPNLTVWPIGLKRGLKNQQAMAIDSIGRPQLAFDKKDQLFLVYKHNDNIAIAAATRAGNFTDWRLIEERTGNFTGEARVDIMRLRNENTLSIYIHERPSKTHEGTPLHVIDFIIKVKQGRNR
jgi:hypothetical protein